MTVLVVERSFGHPLEPEEVDHLFRRLGPCLKTHEVRWIHSYLSSDRRRMFCAFEAADAETVRQAHRVAGVGFEAVWPADRLEPEE